MSRAIGAVLPSGTSKIVSGPLGVIQAGFDGWDLGKTNADAMVQVDQDIKDILYQQAGTKAADHSRTGQDVVVNLTFAEIKTSLLVLMQGGITQESVDSMTIGRELYTSMIEGEAGVLRLVSIDGNGVPSELIKDRMDWYIAIPIVNGDLINWGADTQRNFPVTFRVKFYEFATGESSTKIGAYGYLGDPATEDVPAITWPDVEGPTLETAEATDAVTIEAAFDENIAFQSAFVAGHYAAEVDGVLIAPTAGVIATDTLTLTFPAASFASGEIVTLTITSIALEDTEATANLYAGVSNADVLNSAP